MDAGRIEKLALLVAISEQPARPTGGPVAIRPKILCEGCGKLVAAWNFRRYDRPSPWKRCFPCRKTSVRVKPLCRRIQDYCLQHPAPKYKYADVAAAMGLGRRRLRLLVYDNSARRHRPKPVFEILNRSFRLTRSGSMK